MRALSVYRIMNLKACLLACIAFVVMGITSCTKTSLTNSPSPAQNENLNSTSSSGVKTFSVTSNPIPAANNNKVAYYTFDATPTGNPKVQLNLLNFAPAANIVIIFEGTAWELADSVHYGYVGSPMTSFYYKSYGAILKDVRILQSRGVKVLMNVDDSNTWNTTIPFTTWDKQNLNYQQFAAFANTTINTQLQLDGISLDVEHMGSTPANSNFTNLVKEFGKYFGPLSSNPGTSIYTAAIYDGAQAGFAIGQSTAVAQYMNFVMDMGYFEDNTTRFNRWASYIGPGKTMIALSKDYNSLASGIAAAQYQPSNGNKAGISVYAANVDSAYCNPVFRALNTTTTVTGVVFYQDTQYGATATKAIPKGSYTLSQLKSYGFVGNWASSVKLPSGWTLTMYKGSNLSGTTWSLTASNADFTKLSPSANDVVNSVKIN